MNNKKLIKSLKKSVINQIESDIKKSVIKDFYKNTSKEQLEELKNQIISEVQESFFGVEKEDEKESETNQTYTPIEIPQGLGIKSESSESHKDLESESVKIDAPSIHEHLGFKFDTERMSSIVTGKARTETPKRPGFDDSEGKGVERVDSPNTDNYLTDKFKKLSGFPPFMHTENLSDEVKDRNSEMLTRLKEIKNGGLKEQIKKSDNNSIPRMGSAPLFPPVPQTKDFVKYGARITPGSKEDLTFFLGKLKDGISKLGKGERNINYRRSKDNIYRLSFDRAIASDADDFSLGFQIDLNIDTLEAKVLDFKFSVDGFNFDSSFFDLIEIVDVLNLVGMNIVKYVDEIKEINDEAESTKEQIKENIKTNIQEIRANEELSNFIFDKKIIKVLNSNDINTYGQLKRIEDLTSLKGVGAKTIEKINKYINK